MKLIYFSTTAPIGGHLRSSLTIAKEMCNIGHEVWFVCSDGPGLNLVRSSGMNLFVLPSRSHISADFNWCDFYHLYKFIKTIKPDVIHSFLGGIGQLYIISKLVEAKLVVTICGGKPAGYYPKMNPITVFSGELYKWLVSKRHMPSSVHIIPGRMIFENHKIDQEVYASFIHKLKNDRKICLMICRADHSKMSAIKFFYELAKEYGKIDSSIVFVHIGASNNDDTQEKIEKIVENINRNFKYNILYYTAKGSNSPQKYINLADIVVGMGRSAFEGMSFAKPTLIVSNDGYGGCVSKDTVDNLLFSNFTARYLTNNVNSISLAVKDISRILQDADYARELGVFSKLWLKDNIDVKSAAMSYERIYSNEISHYKPSMLSVSYLIIRELCRVGLYKIKSLK